MPKIVIDVTADEAALWDTSSRIEEIRDELKTLLTKRDELIKKLYDEGYQGAHIAHLGRMTQPRVSQIATGYYDK